MVISRKKMISKLRSSNMSEKGDDMSADQLDHVKSIIECMDEIIEKLDEIGLSNEIKYFGSGLRGGIKATISKKKGVHPDLYGLDNPKISKKDQRIRDCELKLEKVSELYSFYKKASRDARYSFDGSKRGIDISADDLERLRERVERAKINLKIAKGEDPQKFYKSRKQLAKEKAEKDRLEFNKQVTIWQEGWRERAKNS